VLLYNFIASTALVHKHLNIIINVLLRNAEIFCLSLWQETSQSVITFGCIMLYLFLLLTFGMCIYVQCYLFMAGESPLQVELGANLFVYVSLVTCKFTQLCVDFLFTLILEHSSINLILHIM